MIFDSSNLRLDCISNFFINENDVNMLDDRVTY